MTRFAALVVVALALVACSEAAPLMLEPSPAHIETGREPVEEGIELNDAWCFFDGTQKPCY